jgi:hypothetical protein
MKLTTFIIFLLTLCFCSAQAFGECTKGDCQNGEGTFLHPNGDKYVGQFKDGKMEGKGTLISGDGSKYC